MPTGFDPVQLRNCAVMLDTEAEKLTERMTLLYRGPSLGRGTRKLSERRSKLWHVANLLRDIADE